MAKITIAGDCVVITSAKRLDEIKTLEKYMPKALILKDVDDLGRPVDVFRVGSTTGVGSIGKFGASFGSESHDENRFATITLVLPPDIENVADFVTDEIGYPLIKLNQVEEQFALALEEVNAQREEILSKIIIA